MKVFSGKHVVFEKCAQESNFSCDQAQSFPLWPSEGTGEGSRGLRTAGMFAIPGLVTASGQPDSRPLVFGNSTWHVPPWTGPRPLPTGQRVCISPGASGLLGPQSSVPAALDLRLLLDLPAPRRPRCLRTPRSGPCLSLGRRPPPRRTGCHAGHGRKAWDSYVWFFFLFPIPAFHSKRREGWEGPHKRQQIETQSSGKSCISGSSKKGQVQVTMTKEALSPEGRGMPLSGSSTQK